MSLFFLEKFIALYGAENRVRSKGKFLTVASQKTQPGIGSAFVERLATGILMRLISCLQKERCFGGFQE